MNINCKFCTISPTIPSWLKDFRCEYEHWMRRVLGWLPRVFDSPRRLLVDLPSSQGVYKWWAFYEWFYERTYEHSYQPKYESNVSSISSTTDQFIISSENSLEPKRNKTQFENVVMENYRNEEVGQSLLGLAKARAVIENHRDYRGRKFWTYLTRIKQLRGM